LVPIKIRDIGASYRLVLENKGGLVPLVGWYLPRKMDWCLRRLAHTKKNAIEVGS